MSAATPARAGTPAAADPGEAALAAAWGSAPGWYGWLTTTDHKRIGLRFVVTALVFFALAGALAVAMRVQLARPGNTALGPDAYNQAFTTHGTGMMFLFAVPVMEGMGLYLVPLMVGTRNVSFPRLLNFSYYVYLFAGVMLFVSLALNTGPDMGWFSYVPLAGPDYSPGKRVDVWSQMVTLVEISSLAGAVEIVATAFKQRAPGMSLGRVPLFVWTMVVTSFMIIFAMPAVMLSSTMLAADRMPGVGTHFFNQAEGGDALLWQHMFWYFAHPEVYVIFLPATGFLSQIIPTFTRRPVFGYTALVLALVAVAFIGFGVWVHHMFVTPLPRLGQGMFTGSSLMIAVPNGVQIFCWVATLCTGRIRLKTPMLYALGFFANFLVGGLTGVMLASVSIDTQAHDTYFVVAHLHYVLIGGAVFPLLGAVHYWFPKWAGRMPNEGVGRVGFGLVFAGFNLTFFPMHHLGLHGMPRRVYTYLPDQGWGDLNLLATAGALVLAVGLLVAFGNLWRSRRRGALAGDNPWGASTLEWATSSPPPVYNFRHPPTVGGRDPLWESPAAAPVVTGLAEDQREVLVTTLHDAAPDHRYQMARDSVWPFLAAMVLGGMFVGLVFHPLALPVGAAALLVTLLGWFWPHHEPDPIHHPEARGRGAVPAALPDGRPAVDAAGVPAAAHDARSPSWWGNTLFMFIETATVGLLAASYLYLWRNNPNPDGLWPPPRVNGDPPVLDPDPDLLAATLNTLLLLGSCVLMRWVDRQARRRFDELDRLGAAKPSEVPPRDRPPARPARLLAGMLGLIAVGAVAVVLRLFEFQAVKFAWDENAYASVVWAILFTHLLYLLLDVAEVAVMTAWVGVAGFGQNQAIDVILTAYYWYWTVGAWVVLYAVVYWFPRVV